MLRVGDLKRILNNLAAEGLPAINDDTEVRIVDEDFGREYKSYDLAEVRVSDDGTKLFFVSNHVVRKLMERN